MRARRGLFREANGGTIFLDEIGDIDASGAEQAAARAAGARDQAGRRRSPGRRSTCASSRRRTRTSRRSSRAASSARTSTGGSRSCRSRCRRCASARRTSRCSPRTSSRAARGAAKSFAGSEARYPTQITAKALARLMTLSLAGQHPRARERAVARGDPVRRRDDPLARSRHARPRSRSRRHRRVPATRSDRVELPPIDLERLGDGEGLKDSPSARCAPSSAPRLPRRSGAIATRRPPRSGSASAARASTRR